MTIELHNKKMGKYREAPIGFSWTTLLFGCFPAIFRSDWKWAAIGFILALLTGGISWFVMPFFYNKLYIKDLLKDGYVPVDSKNAEILVYKGIITNNELNFYMNN